MSLLPRSIAVQPPSAIANFRPIVPTEPLGVRTLRVQAGTDASVRRKPPDTRGIPRAVPSTAEHDRSRTRIARDTVPVWEPPSRRRHFGLWTNRREIRRQPRQPLHQPTPETRQTGGFVRRSPRVRQHTRERRGRWRRRGTSTRAAADRP
uniref:(northern house mosquito) hypothetical protein n=1 Tax=Culex pipiens TaxID=7175 RepID=A0A8D8DML1_CULPI